jgi:hypothetical protein
MDAPWTRSRSQEQRLVPSHLTDIEHVITSASHVSVVGVSGDQFAVNSGDSGSSGACAGQAKRPKNAPRKLEAPHAVTAFLGSLRRSGRRFDSAVAGDPRTDGV